MKIAILSDTHNNEEKVKEFLDAIRDQGISTVLHAGDLTGPGMVELFKEFDLKLAFGNCDHDKEGIEDECRRLGLDIPDYILDLHISKKRIALAHEPYRIEEHLQSGNYDYVIHGHTHRAKEEIYGKTILINPGALFRASYYTYVILDLGSGSIDFYEV